MSIATVNVGAISSGVLGLHEAAAHCGFTTRTFDLWVRRGLLPPASVDGRFWTGIELDSALERIQQFGFQFAPIRKSAEYRSIPGVQPQLRRDSLGRIKYHYYCRGVPGALEGEPGSPAFMRCLIGKLRQLAAAQSSQESSPHEPDLDTAPEGGKHPNSRAGGLFIPSRRRAQVRQADIARVIRAAKQAGASQIEVRLTDSSRVIVHLQPENSANEDGEIIL